MTTIEARAGTAELWLISDWAVDEDQRRAVRDLFGERTTDDDVEVAHDGRLCRWPLRVTHEAGPVDSLPYHISLCAGFLRQRRHAIERIHSLGCNLELRLSVASLPDDFYLSSGTMKVLGELQVQLSLVPIARPGAPLVRETQLL